MLAGDEVFPSNRRRRSRRRRRRALRRSAVVTFLLVIAVVVGLLVGGVFAGAAALTSSCSLSSLRPLGIGQNSFVFAADGSLLGSIPSTRNRQPLELGQISKWLPQATVAIEDRRFWKHGALDYQGIIRAAVKNLAKGRVVEGGSTITQQLVRNLYIGSEQRTVQRKLKEACLALKVAKIWSKKRILATYLNQVYYGNHAYGAEAAAQTYLSKSARRLGLAQAALLAGLPQAPSIYDPLKSPDAALDRRNEVLRSMLTAHSITLEQYDYAVRRPLGLKLGRVYTEIRQPYFFGYVEQQLVNDFGANRVRNGGLRVRTTIDPRLQNLANQAMRDHLPSRQDPASALVAIDPRSGKIRAMAVRVPSGERLQFNLASQGHRQAGSSFKPFVLATAVEDGISLSSGYSGPSQLTISDRRCYTGFQPWDVHNFADESGGYMSLFEATAHSVNTIFAQLVVQVGPDNVVRVAHKMGITSPLQPVCSITLGTQPVSPLEMASAYGTLAARGIRHPPQSLKFVRGPAGKLLGKLVTKGTRALDQNTADLVTQALEGVVTHGTGTAAGFGRPAAGKTGTAENFQDAWFCGYVPQLVTCVWVGYPHREQPLIGVEGWGQVFGGSIPAAIWHDFMSGALASAPVLDFPSAVDTGHVVSPPSSYSNVPTTKSTTSTTTTGATTTPTAPAATTPPAPAPTPTFTAPATTAPATPPPPPTTPPPTTAPTPTEPPPTTAPPPPEPPPASP